MAEVTDDFGRVKNFTDAAVDAVKKILTAAVGDAVKFANDKSKKENKSQEEITQSQKKLLDVVSELDKTTKESIESFEKLVKEIQEVEKRIQQLESSKKTKKQEDFKSIAQEQLRVLNQILESQRKAQSAKIASFSATTPLLSAPQAGTNFKNTAPSENISRRFKKQKVVSDEVQKVSNYAKGLVNLINNVFGQLDRRDNVLIGARSGEYVIRKEAANVLGKRNLDQLNRADKIRKHNKGGFVKGYVEGGSIGGVPGGPTGTRPTTVAGYIRQRISGVQLPPINEDPRTRADYEDVGQRLVDYIGHGFKYNWRRKAAAWFTGVSSMMLGGQADFFKVLFGGAVTDITNFRRELRSLAFEIEGINSTTRDLQGQFSNMGRSINETGKSLDAVYKSYLQNSKKGFKSQKDGLKVIKSGLYFSTMIGSATEQTAEMFSDWYRTLNLSADQMGRLARDSRYVAISTGVTGDELLGAMKSSENILRNLKNQGNLTTSAARNVIEMMAQAKKLGIEDQAGKVLGALSGTNPLLNADPKMKGFILAMTNRMGRGATQSALAGTFMQDKSNLSKFADEMDRLVSQLTGGRARGVQDLDKLDAQTRMRLSIQLQGLTGMEIDEFKRTQEIFKTSSQTLGSKLESLEKQINKRTATESEKLKATQQKQLLLLNASSGFLSSLSEAANREENSNMGDAVRDALSKMSADEVRDLDQLITHLDASTMAKLEGFKGDEKKFLAAGLLSSQKLKEAAKQHGMTVKDFGPDLIDAMQRGDMARLRTVSEELSQASQRLDVEMKMATDPITKLAFTLNQYNETIRTFTSKFVGGIIDLLGPMNLLAVQIGLLAAGIYSTFGKDVLSHFGFDALFKLSDFRKKPDNPFSTMTGSMGRSARGEGTIFQRILKAWKGILRSIDRGLGSVGKRLGDFFRKGQFLPKTFRNAYAASRANPFSGGLLKSIFKGIYAQLRYVLKPVLGAFVWLGTQIQSVINRTLRGIVWIADNTLGRLGRFLTSKLDAMATRSAQQVTKAMQGGRTVSGLSRWLKYTSEVLERWGRNISSWWSGLFDGAKWRSWISGMLDLRAWRTWFAGIGRGIGNIVEGGVKGIFGKLGDAIEGAFKWIRTPIKVARKLPVLNLIFAVIDGIIGAVTGFMSASDHFKTLVEDTELGYGKVTAGMYASATVGGTLAGVLDGLSFGIISLLGLRKPIERFFSFFIFGVLDSLWEFGKGVYEAFDISWLMGQFSELGAQFTDLINSIFGSDFADMGEAFASLMKTLKPAFNVLGKVVGFIASAIVNVVGGVLVGALKTIVAICQGIVALVGGIRWFFSNDFSWQKLFDGIAANMKWVWDGMVSWASGLGNTLYEGFQKALQDVWSWFTSWAKDGRTDEQKASYDRLQTLYAKRNALGPAEKRWYELSSQRADVAKRELPALEQEIARLEQTAVAPGMLWGSDNKTVAERNGTVQNPNDALKKSQIVGSSDFSSDHLVSTQQEMLKQGQTSLGQQKIMADTLEMGQTEGSIYVHDIHVESLLLEIFKLQKRMAGEELDSSAISEYMSTLETIRGNPERGAELALKKSRVDIAQKQIESEQQSWNPLKWLWGSREEELKRELEGLQKDVEVPSTKKIEPTTPSLPDGFVYPMASKSVSSNVVAKTDFDTDHMVNTQSEMVSQGEMSLRQGQIMAKTLKMGQQVGSMYVHDTHCEAMLYMILEQLRGNKPDINTYKSIKATLADDPEKGIEKIMENITPPSPTTPVAESKPQVQVQKPIETKPVPVVQVDKPVSEIKPKQPEQKQINLPTETPKPADVSSATERVSLAVAEALPPTLAVVSSRALEEAQGQILASMSDIKTVEADLAKATDEATKKTLETKLQEHKKVLSSATKKQQEEVTALSKGLEKEYDVQSTVDERTGLIRLAKRKKAEEIKIKKDSDDIVAGYRDNDDLRKFWEKESATEWGTKLSFEDWLKEYDKTSGPGYIQGQIDKAASTLPTDMMDDRTYLAWQEHMTKQALQQQKDNLYSLTEEQALKQGMAKGSDPIFSDKFKEEYNIDGLLKSQDKIIEESLQGNVGGEMKIVESNRIQDALERERLDLERLQREKVALGPAKRTWGEFLTFQDKARAQRAQRELPDIERRIDAIQKRRATPGYLQGERKDLITGDYYIGWDQEMSARLPGSREWMPGQYHGSDGAGLYYRQNKESLPGPVLPDGTPIKTPDASLQQLEQKTQEANDAAALLHSTPVGHHAVPALKEDEVSTGVGAVQPVHLRDITESILRDKTSAQAGTNKLQSDELARIEQASDQQVTELEQIKEGIREMVSLLKPKGNSIAGDSDGIEGARTRDPRRPLHAAQFGKMKYGKPGGNANRALINNGEV